MQTFRAGIDIGSTTVKLVLLDQNDQMVFGRYIRHRAHTQKALADLLREAREQLGPMDLSARITGSGSINLGKVLGIPFEQEVVAVAGALKHRAPQTDVAIELGGEDAKIIYFRGGLEERMNGVCAGGTGSFIDQMAALLQTDATGLNEAAADYKVIYPIAARCGVFAKSDIQPLINDGAATADLAASIFQAVVNQTISGLACGKPIRGCVAFLGGPLHFLPELKKAFIRTLKLTPETVVDVEDSHLFGALGAALMADGSETVSADTLIEKLSGGIEMAFELKRLPRLFENQQDYEAFCLRHEKARVHKTDLSHYQGSCYLGIDAGSTTTKLALVGEDGSLLYSFYAPNEGSPIETARRALREIQLLLPPGTRIQGSCSTGYGETLMKAAFGLDHGEVETIAHYTAAAYFDPAVDCILDIGGQDMKCIKLKNGSVDTVLLNEACSSGCGSFIENFANSLGLSAAEFAKEAIYAENPVDLGTRCTVFMNSNVKQAQKEGAKVSDISAGLAYSVIKNALFKVIKLSDARELGTHIVLQGGTFYNQAVLRAFEAVSGVHAVCPDISGIMGAFGAALIARDRCSANDRAFDLDAALSLEYKTATTHCGGCQNRCMLTINTFSGGRKHISGNRCEKGQGQTESKDRGENLFAYKLQRWFRYEPLSEDKARRGTIGIPRVLNIYENYPYWATFFKELGFRVVLSPASTRKIYELGMESIPSESECYPAKLSHGHVEWLIKEGVKTIFHPCVFYEQQETRDAQNNYNCPIVISYPENLKNNVEAVTEGQVQYMRPFISFTSENTAADRLVQVCNKQWSIGENEVRAAAYAAWTEQLRAKQDLRAEGERALKRMEKAGKKGIVLAGRPYHADPEINHGLPEMIAGYGLTVFPAESLPLDFIPERPLRVVDQWVYHSRLYNAAEFVRSRKDLELVQLNSFGCGLDAVTTDQVADILENSNKLYTVLKIDEVNNLGAARIRIRSLLSAMDLRDRNQVRIKPAPAGYRRVQFTRRMFKEGYTIICPQMSPIHFELIEPVMEKYGLHIKVLDNDNRNAIETGLRFVNNDACFPSITVVGQIMDAVLSGEYDTDKLAILMAQTGGCCRASNYVGFIRKALEKVGLGHIPVISLNANGMEKNEGFRLSPALLKRALYAVTYGDLFMRCLYHVRPYEKEPDSANRLHKKWVEIAIDSLVNDKTQYSYRQVCRGIVQAFDELPIYENMKKPRVGIVGEILVKYMPLANNHLVDLLEKEGAEVIVTDLLDFMDYCIYNGDYKYKYLGKKWTSWFLAHAGVRALQMLRKPAFDALKASRRFEPPAPIQTIAEMAKPFLSLGNQYGEGWFLTGEMAELITHDVPNIICIQPFACLPNHVVGKGVIKAMKKAYPWANIAAVDYDPGASEVNQLNRIKLMLSQAKTALNEENNSHIAAR